MGLLRSLLVAACAVALSHSLFDLAAALPYFEIESQKTVQTSLLTTRYFEPGIYAQADYAASFNGESHLASPSTSKGETISLSKKSFTIDLWIRHDREEEQELPAYFISQGSTSAPEAGERLTVGFKADHSFEMSFYDGQPLVTEGRWHGDRGQWHHWAITFDEVTMQRVVYRDGIMVGSDLSGTQLIAASGLKLGHGYVTDIKEDIYFDGALDEVRLWETVLDIGTLRLYASLTSAWVTEFHPDLAYLLAYFDFNEGEGNSAEDSGPAGYDADLQCGSKGSTCTSTSSWWVSGVGSRSLSLGKVHRIRKICPTPALAYLDYNNTRWTYPEYERRGEIKPLPACTTDLQHRHEALCTVDFSLHIAYQSGNIEGFPRYYICDGVKWMPIHFNHQIWNNFELP